MYISRRGKKDSHDQKYVAMVTGCQSSVVVAMVTKREKKKKATRHFCLTICSPVPFFFCKSRFLIVSVKRKKKIEGLTENKKTKFLLEVTCDIRVCRKSHKEGEKKKR